jgi:hypothetical protein
MKTFWLCWLIYFPCVVSAVYRNRIVLNNYWFIDYKFSYKWNACISLCSLSILIFKCKARSLPIEGGTWVGCSLIVKYFTNLRTCHWQTFFAYFDLSVTNSFCQIVTRPPGKKSYIVTHEKARFFPAKPFHPSLILASGVQVNPSLILLGATVYCMPSPQILDLQKYLPGANTLAYFKAAPVMMKEVL